MYNNIQIDGKTEDIICLNRSIKMQAFNWHVVECAAMYCRCCPLAIRRSKAIFQKPTVIIARNIPGRSIFMENNYLWHSQPFGPGQAEQAIKELKEIEAKLRKE